MGDRAYIKFVIFLSTPSARRATVAPLPLRGIPDISIHALREEGDQGALACHSTTNHFYPRPPRGGRRYLSPRKFYSLAFLSTPSARRATGLHHDQRRDHFISIHALREEGDSKNGEKHLRFCFIIKRSAQIWKSLSKNIRKNSCDLHRTA